MAVMFYDRDADLNLIKSRKVAVIGTDPRDTRTHST